MAWQPSRYLQQVAELERDDPEIRELGYRVWEAMENDGDVDAANDAFQDAVEARLEQRDDDGDG